MTIALNRLKSLSLEPGSLVFFFIIVFIEDVSPYSPNTMPVMILNQRGHGKMGLCGKKEKK
jgi:hypothetical protein